MSWRCLCILGTFWGHLSTLGTPPSGRGFLGLRSPPRDHRRHQIISTVATQPSPWGASPMMGPRHLRREQAPLHQSPLGTLPMGRRVTWDPSPCPTVPRLLPRHPPVRRGLHHLQRGVQQALPQRHHQEHALRRAQLGGHRLLPGGSGGSGVAVGCCTHGWVASPTLSQWRSPFLMEDQPWGGFGCFRAPR